MGDFNIDPLKSETCDFFNNFLLSLQSYSFFPTIDKPTRVYNNLATLIDNIFVNRIDSNNIVSDISDHYSQFALFRSPSEKIHLKKRTIRDFSHFVHHVLSLWTSFKLIGKLVVQLMIPIAQFYNKLNKLINKQSV